MNAPNDELRQELEQAKHTIATLMEQIVVLQQSQRSDEREADNTSLLPLLRDLETARRQIERAHHEWMAALDAIEDPVFMHDREFRVLRANRAYQQRAGLPFEEIIGRPYYEIFPRMDGPLPGCRQAMEAGKDGEEEELLLDGRCYRSRAFPMHDAQGEYLYSVHGMEDITERKLTEERLRESEAFTKTVLDNLPLGIAVNSVAPVVEFKYMNENFPRLYRTTKERLSTPGAFWDAVYEDAGFRQQMSRRVLEDCASGDAGRMHWDDVPITRRGEETTYVSARNILLPDQQMMISMVWDISERKRHELALQRANRTLRTVRGGNQALIHATEEERLLHQMCDVAVQTGGYRMAWIGYVRGEDARRLEPMAQAGFASAQAELPSLSWDAGSQPPHPVAAAAWTGRTSVVQDIQAGAGDAVWREHAQRHGYASYIALPLLDGERVFGVLVLFDDKVSIFDADEVNLLEEMAADLAFGILTLRVKAEQREHEMRLRQNMLQTVAAIAGIIELRDPYTSGHQTRVAELARAIALQIGLPEEEAQAIHLAGLVHDLGKIRIPAELLSKPGRLNEVEYSLIKMHPQAGYDILKNVDFSWPIAEMVLQHHEHMDGSGYPQGLQGDAILFGARILTVADVVESMASHRPYRAGLGLDAALGEISAARGVRYDERAVDACVALFMERGYVLPA